MSTNTESLHVLHVLSSDAFAGVERHALRLVEELRLLGCRAELACPSSAQALRSRARAVRLPVHTGFVGLGALRPSIVHVHDGRSAVAGSPFAWARGAYLVRTQHFVRPASVAREGWRGSASTALHRLLNRSLDGYIAVSHAVEDAARARGEIGLAQVAVIPSGIDLPEEKAVAEAKAMRLRADHPVICSVGRLEPERRFDVLIDAIPKIRTKVPNCRFIIAGSGSMEIALRRQAHQLGVEDAITWTGWLREVEPTFAQSHVYVNTLPLEGFGMATAEAMGFALPVVATSSGASAELVEDKVTGYLVSPSDPVALAAAICRLIDNRELAAAMGDTGRSRAVCNYSARQTAISTLSFYRSLSRVVRRK